LTAKALLLAAGRGTRLKPITIDIPKCLVQISGRPLLDYWLDLLGDAAIQDILINTHSHPDQVRSYISEVNKREAMVLRESHEPELLGSAGTVTANPDFADDADAIIIIYADNLSAVSLEAMLHYHRSHDDPFTMMLFHASDPRTCGIASLEKDNHIVSFVEKPEHPESNLANAGVYILDREAYREVAAMEAFDFGYDVIPRFVGRMRGWVWDGYHRDIGTPQAYEQAQKDAIHLLQQRGYDLQCTRPAVFLDRDGTLIEHVDYLADPAAVRLLPGIPESLRKLRRLGFACVVVSNQSAIARGMLTEEGLYEINREMCRQLAEHDAVVDAIYWCPELPKSKDRYAVDHPDRKPGPGMLLRAVRELNIRIEDSWMIGDMISDVLAGLNAGCRGSIYVESGKKSDIDDSCPDVDFQRFVDFPSAVPFIIDSMHV